MNSVGPEHQARAPAAGAAMIAGLGRWGRSWILPWAGKRPALCRHFRVGALPGPFPPALPLLGLVPAVGTEEGVGLLLERETPVNTH